MTAAHDRAEPARMIGGPSAEQVAERARQIGLRMPADDLRAAVERLRAIGRALAAVPAFAEVPASDEDEGDRPDPPFDPRWS